MAKHWMPNDEVKAWLRATYAYDPKTGIVSRGGFPVGAHRENNGYMRVRVRNAALGLNTLASIHRLAWFFISGEFTTGDVDHINMDRADNRACNLRAATRSQNMRNMTKCAASKSSRYKGVSRVARDGRWSAQITTRVGNCSVPLVLGRFDTEEDAARAYDAAALEHHGPFARLNLPKERAA